MHRPPISSCSSLRRGVRRLVSFVVLFAVAMAPSLAPAQLPRRAEAERPNIIFIMADDLGYGDLGCFGQQQIATPNIDRLAVEGTRFTECYAGSTVCAPSRSVLMTGLHTGHTTVRGNKALVGGVQPEGRVPLEPEDITVAEVLHKAGYATGISGKWGLGEPGTGGIPNRQGFDEWLGYLNQNHAHFHYPTYLWRNEQEMPLAGNQDGGREEYSHDHFTRFALDFIRRHVSEPFFLYMPYTVPHAAFEVPSVDPYRDRDWPTDAVAYAAMITRLDGDVGRIAALLAELGLDDKTLVFFCSDNGAAQRWEGILDSSGPLRGSKRDMYEGGIRTPMIARWPGHVPAGRTSDAPWYFADFLPTAAELAGAEPPKGLDGTSVLPTLLGQPQELADRYFYWEFFERNFQQAVRWRDWKAVRLEPGAELELYDLATDSAEQDNVAGEHPKVVARIENYLKTARTESTHWPVDWVKP